MRPAHPLCYALIARLPAGSRVVELGTGSGRNRQALVRAGMHVDDLAPRNAAEPYDAALSTHALLHGRPEEIRAHVARVAIALRPGAPFHATFGSTQDARFGIGEQLARETFAPQSGDEIGIPHTFWEYASLQHIIQENFVIESLEEVSVDEIVGKWAHTLEPLKACVHWFAQLQRRR